MNDYGHSMQNLTIASVESSRRRTDGASAELALLRQILRRCRLGCCAGLVLGRGGENDLHQDKVSKQHIEK